MKTGAITDRQFRNAMEPPPASEEPKEGSRIQLYSEPQEDIRVLGELVRDVGVMRDLLSGLAFAGADEYKRNLRVVKSAAERMITRCDRLIGEKG